MRSTIMACNILYINIRGFAFAHRVFRVQIASVNMKAMIALLFLAAVAVYAKAEMEYHPQAVMHYLEMEDREMAKKVRSIVKLEDPGKLGPSFRPSFRPSFLPTGRLPSGFPTGMPPAIVSVMWPYFDSQLQTR